MPFPFPSTINEKRYSRVTYVSIVLAILSWPAFIVLDADRPYCYIPFLIIASTIGAAYYIRKWGFLLYLIVNPLVLMILFYIALPTTRYFSGEPTLIYCCYDTHTFDKNEMLYLHYYDDDCEFGDMMYICSDDLNNAITHFWVNVFGNPIDVVPDDLEPEEIYEPGDL